VRTVWFLAGGAAGVYATSKVRRVTEALSYDGVHDRLTGWFAGARVIRHELRAGRTEKEVELRERLSLGTGATVLALPGSEANEARPTGPDDSTTDESRGEH
jgi:hypothetical protein